VVVEPVEDDPARREEPAPAEHPDEVELEPVGT
jgi:hypothetical protein